MTDADRQLLTEINDRLKRLEARLPMPCDSSDHEVMMMVGTAPDLLAAVKQRNQRIKSKGLRRRSDG